MATDLGEQIIRKARELGAVMAGIADLEAVRQSPSHRYLSRMGTVADGLPANLNLPDFTDVPWPPQAKSVVVIGVAHPRDEPHLDWFETTGNTPGNRILIRINKELAAWIEETLAIKAHKMSYYVEKFGIYLKDAAVMAGLGCLGRNNMLVTPSLGPHVRLRALLVERQLTPTGPMDFDPCDGCDDTCRTACPQGAFDTAIYPPDESGVLSFPALDGTFSRARCRDQMNLDIEAAGMSYDEPSAIGLDTEQAGKSTEPVKHCRVCEFACPVGQ